MKKYSKLIMVTGENNNKYYEMEWDGISPNFNVKYGRVESTVQTATYPSHQWDKKYREKVNKGYKDITHTVQVKVVPVAQKEVELSKVKEQKVQRFLDLMQKYTKGLVSQTYTVKSQDVTQEQVDNAQGFIDKLKKCKKSDTTGINNLLLELYMEIPRRMAHVQDYLLPLINIDNVIQQEQDNLDAMASQVKMYNKETKQDKEEKLVEEKTILDLLGVKKMKEINGSKEIDYLTKQITGKKVQAIFEVEKTSEDKRFDDWLSKQENKRTKYVYHGTKCTSVIPILEQGLKIRPSGNFQFSGKAYGNGNYFSEQFATSLGYTDGHRTGDSVMLIYEVHTGKESKSSFHDYKSCKAAGYDSFEGGWLRVAYREEQARIKYIIWLN